MTPLRQRMIDAMQLRGLAARTQQAYVAAVAALARHSTAVPSSWTANRCRRICCTSCASGTWRDPA